MPMSAKKREEREKKTYLEWGHADVNALLWMALRADANECKKKREEKKTYLEWGHTDVNVLRADGVACGWCCVRMVLHADGVACGRVVWGRGWW